MSTGVWISVWDAWEKSPKEGEGGTAKTDKTSGPLLACAVCGGTARWNDHGVERCQVCWPMPLTRRARELEQTEQARGDTRRARTTREEER
jgi:hypothetical protein